MVLWVKRSAGTLENWIVFPALPQTCCGTEHCPATPWAPGL